LLNNQIGRNIGEKNKGLSKKELSAKVLDEFHKNGLYTAKQNKDGSVTIEKTKISDAQYKTAQEKLGKLTELGRFPEKQKVRSEKFKEANQKLQEKVMHLKGVMR
jgi:hypothetical protein